MDDVIQCRDVEFGYKSMTSVLDGVTLNVPRGSIYGLLGPNGCGKSTLMKLLLGLHRASGGSVRVFGASPADEPVEVRSRIGYVPQENDLDPELTAHENLELIGSFYGERWNASLAERLVDALDVDVFDPVKSLSGGLQQRVALVAALAVEPEILLLDEPAKGLDALVRREFAETMIDFVAADPSRTVVLSSHLLSEIESLVDHVGFITGETRANRLILEAPLATVKERITLVEIADPQAASTLPEALRVNRLSRSTRGTVSTTTLWLETPEEEELAARWVRDVDGRILHQASLDDIFVRMYRDDPSWGPGAVHAGRLRRV